MRCHVIIIIDGGILHAKSIYVFTTFHISFSRILCEFNIFCVDLSMKIAITMQTQYYYSSI